MKEYSEYAAVPIALSDGVKIIFRARFVGNSRAVEIGGVKHQVFYYRYIYERRIDEHQTLVMPPCEYEPPEFHGCLTAACQILRICNSQNLVYEGDVDVTLYPRQIVQATAGLYTVDPSEMMAQWSRVRPYLLNDALDIPASIEDAINVLKRRGDTAVKGGT